MNYRGKRPKGGMSVAQVAAVAILTLLAVMAMTLKVGADWTGQSVGEQIHEALFETQDWE